MGDSLALRIFARVNSWFANATAVLIVAMMVTVTYDVFARVLFHAPTLWVIDINEYLLVYLAFLPAAWILLRDSHVKVELVVSRLGHGGRYAMDLFSHFLGMVYCVILTWEGWQVTSQAYVAGYTFSTALAAPQWPVYMIIPLGAAWLALGFLVRLLTAGRRSESIDKA